MSQALYRKYRSKTLSEVVGQEHITELLEAAIKADSINHAYLLTGPRGVGKTSIARIIAHQINQLPYEDETNHLDIIEIDAASNNGVEDVRDLREKVHIAPSSARYKVYIIDEVHMLSKQAFNALLKTLEEPPAHVVFILATTDVDKLPSTIISRVQRFNFRSIPRQAVIDHLKTIAKQENIKIDDESLDIVARHGGGSFRDSIGLLDQLRHVSDDINRQQVENLLGIASDDAVGNLLSAYRAQNLKELASQIQALDNSGAQASIVTKQLIEKIHASIIEHPEDITVIAGLLDVASSSYPFVKLLTVLAPRIEPATPTVKPAAAQPPPVPTTPPAPTSAPKPVKPVAKSNDNTAAKEQSETAGIKPTPSPAPKQISKLPFDWQALLAATKAKSIAVHSLLNQAQYTCDETDLRIFAGKNFSAKRLESAKYQTVFHEALAEIGGSHLEVTISAATKPPEDTESAAIAAIMGGGEEVKLNG